MGCNPRLLKPFPYNKVYRFYRLALNASFVKDNTFVFSNVTSRCTGSKYLMILEFQEYLSLDVITLLKIYFLRLKGAQCFLRKIFRSAELSHQVKRRDDFIKFCF